MTENAKSMDDKAKKEKLPMPKCPVKVGKAFKSVSVIDQGSFGIVYLAIGLNDETCAIKCIPQDPKIRSREIKVMLRLHHHNCVKLRRHFQTHDKEYDRDVENIVMEYLPENLSNFDMKFVKNHDHIPIILVKLFAYQMFSGLNHMHTIGYIHRDIKTSNLLIDPETGVLKICDFGSAKRPKPGQNSICYAGSRLYRAIESFLHSETCGAPMDIWSAGCVITRMLRGVNPIFASRTSEEMIDLTMNILGTPTPEDIQDMNVKFSPTTQYKRKPLQILLPSHTPDDIIDLLNNIFVYSPKKRFTAAQCMQHPCFSELFKMDKLPNGHPMPPLDEVPK